jgi:hypothetical protein
LIPEELGVSTIAYTAYDPFFQKLETKFDTLPHKGGVFGKYRIQEVALGVILSLEDPCT